MAAIVLTTISTVINYSWNRANLSVIPSPVVNPRSMVSKQTIALKLMELSLEIQRTLPRSKRK